MENGEDTYYYCLIRCKEHAAICFLTRYIPYPFFILSYPILSYPTLKITPMPMLMPMLRIQETTTLEEDP